MQTGKCCHIRMKGGPVVDKKQLQDIIEKLHRELASADSVDAESRVLLQELVQDVEKLAGGSNAAGAGNDMTTGQLQNAALRFESEHPKLSMALGEVVDALGKLGI